MNTVENVVEDVVEDVVDDEKSVHGDRVAYWILHRGKTPKKKHANSPDDARMTPG